MNYFYRYREKEISKNVLDKIFNIAEKLSRQINIMEVCGTHTMAIGKYGIRKAMPENINLISGPGCPVCVCPDSYLDKAIELSGLNDVIIATFGDMMRVPGSYSSLEKEKSKGADIKVVYSPIDAVEVAEKNPDKKVIFLSIGFETTVPPIAVSIKAAKRKGLKNFFILCGNKLIPPAMEFLLKDENIKIDGFIAPGHVSTVIGVEPYSFIPEHYGIPVVISGFEPLDILQSIYFLVESIFLQKPSVINQYKRCVEEKGNLKAKEIMYEIFEITDSEWRGIGEIEKSGLKLNKDYENFDIENEVRIKIKKSRKKSQCICGQVIKGIKKPVDCKLFGKVCTAENPVGPCMVSSEGTCAAYYKYEMI